MEVYVVTYDDHYDSWGASISLDGVYSTREKAEEALKTLPFAELNAVTIDEKATIYLGGYIE